MLRLIVYLPLVLLVSPFTGAMLRGWQGCCLQFSMAVARWLWPCLLLAVAARLVPWFEKHRYVRATVWWCGLTAWCLGAPISCLHALS